MSHRIVLSAENLQEMFRVEIKHIKMWTRLGFLPSIEGRSPIGYDKREIDQWVADGHLDKHRPLAYHHRKGVWSKPPKGE